MTVQGNVGSHSEKPVRHIVFDLDGTLVDSVFICSDIGRAMLAARGGDIDNFTVQSLRRNISVGGAALVADMLGPWASDPVSDLAEFRERYADMKSPISSVYPGVVEVLQLLNERYESLSICSNKPQELCEKVLFDLGLEHFFKSIVGSRSGIQKKPDTALLDLVLEQVGGTRAECLYVGDSEVDWELSNNASVRFVGVSYGYGDFEAHQGSMCLLGSFRELLTIDLDRPR